jgi:hypothetical protein
MTGFAESHVEEAALAWLAELGYATANGLDIGPDGGAPERAAVKIPHSNRLEIFDRGLCERLIFAPTCLHIIHAGNTSVTYPQQLLPPQLLPQLFPDFRKGQGST